MEEVVGVRVQLDRWLARWAARDLAQASVAVGCTPYRCASSALDFSTIVRAPSRAYQSEKPAASRLSTASSKSTRADGMSLALQSASTI